VIDPFAGHLAISSVNFAEVVTKLVESGATGSEIERILAPVGLEVFDADRALAFEAAALRTVTRPFGLSLGDRFALALALRLHLPVLTADQNWGRLDLAVPIVLIR